jgi:hypothetical protein
VCFKERKEGRGGARATGMVAMGSTLLNNVAGVEERGEGAVGGGHAAGRSWGRAWGTGAAVGQRGAAGTGPEPTCAGERHTPVQNRGGRVAARGVPVTVPGGGG